MGQLDLKVSDARWTMIKKMLTTRMMDRLKDEEVDHKKVRRRDRSNNLLVENVDTLVKEEGKLNLHLKQVAERARAQERKRGNPRQCPHVGNRDKPKVTQVAGHVIMT